MKTKTILILGAAALYFYGPRLTARVASEAGEMLDNATDSSETGRPKARRAKALPQPQPAETSAFGSNDASAAEPEGGSFEERAAAAHMSRRNGKSAMRSGTDGI